MACSADNEMLTSEECEEALDAEDYAEDSDLSFQTTPLVDDEVVDKSSSKLRNMFHFQKEHPLHGSHAMYFIRDNSRRVPNFAGANCRDMTKETGSIIAAQCLHCSSHGETGLILRSPAKVLGKKRFKDIFSETMRLI